MNAYRESPQKLAILHRNAHRLPYEIRAQHHVQPDYLMAIAVIATLNVLTRSIKQPSRGARATSAAAVAAAVAAAEPNCSWDAQIDFESEMLMANLRDTKRKIISETNAKWCGRLSGPNAREVEVVHDNCPNQKDFIVNNDKVVASLEELYTMSCEPHIEDQLGVEEEVRLFGSLPPCYWSHYETYHLGVRRRLTFYEGGREGGCLREREGKQESHDDRGKNEFRLFNSICRVFRWSHLTLLGKWSAPWNI